MKLSVFHAAHSPLGQPPEEKAMDFLVLHLLSWVCYPLEELTGQGMQAEKSAEAP